MRFGAWIPRLPSTKAGRRLSVMALIDSTGTGLFLAASAIFFTKVVGLSTSKVGIGLSCAGIVGLGATALWGKGMDHIGARRILVTLNLWRACGFVAYCLVQGFGSFLAVVCFLALADRAVSPATQLLVAETVGGDDQVRTMAVLRSMRNVGFTIGALLATIAIHIGTRGAYQVLVLIDAATFLAAAVIVAGLRTCGRAGKRIEVARRSGRQSVFRDRVYMRVVALNGVLTLHMTLLAVGIPLWVVQETRAPALLVGPLLLINTVLTILLQVRASRDASTVSGSARCLRRAGIALSVCCLLLALGGWVSSLIAIPVLVAAVIAQTVGELTQAAGGWGLSYALAPEGSRGEYLTVFSFGATIQQIVGPALFASGVIRLGAPGWVVLAALFLVTAAAAGTVPRWAERSPPLIFADAVHSLRST